MPTRFTHQNKWRNKPAPGITLIELLVTLTILTILLTIAIPGFQDFFANNRVATINSELVASLNLARSEATKRGQRVVVCRSSTPLSSTAVCNTGAWTAGRIVFVDADSDGARDSTELILRTYAPLTTGALTGGEDLIVFTPTGATTLAAETTLNLCVGGKQRSVSINKMGRVRVAEGTC